jgi:hypothetical protein
MGFMKTFKSDIARDGARHATEEGRQVFVYKFDLPTLNSSVSAGISGAAECIEAIESEGWRLASFAANDQSRNGSLIMIYRKKEELS